MTEFTLQTYQNEYLAAGAGDVDAIVEVRATGGTTDRASGAAEVIMIDTSGSMDRRHKIDSAKTATMAAIDCIRDGVYFGVIAGEGVAHSVYPPFGSLVPADERARWDAKSAVSTLTAGGGTAMGRWLMAARLWLAPFEGFVRHAIMLTDGRNEGESASDLEAALEACEGVFQCECRGVGTDWKVDELRTISTRLLGTVGLVAEPSTMTADFESMIRGAMAKRTADVALHVWVPRGATIRSFRQVAPEVADLSVHASPIDDQTTAFATGAWGDETREYHLAISVASQRAGEEMRAGRVSVVVDGEVLANTRLRAIWTDDPVESTTLNPRVVHYTGQAELAAAVASGLRARQEGDDVTATTLFGRAAQLAHESGNDATLAALRGVVDIEDAATGTVRPKKKVDALDEMALDTRSVKTVVARTG